MKRIVLTAQGDGAEETLSVHYTPGMTDEDIARLASDAAERYSHRKETALTVVLGIVLALVIVAAVYATAFALNDQYGWALSLLLVVAGLAVVLRNAAERLQP